MRYFLLLTGLLLYFSSCTKEYADSYIKTPDWSDSTHSNNIEPSYNRVFSDGRVRRFDISISPEDWAKMQVDLTSHIKITNPPSPIDPSWTPMWVACSFVFEGKEWYKVGIRYKGNSSLRSCIQRNLKKYSFKLDFDQFENDYPAIRNQRFYGFKQLNLVNGFDDMTLMREKTAADLFRRFGVPSARCAFVEIWMDYGEGRRYMGLYTMVEEVEEGLIQTQLEPGGNLYKPEGPAATFAYGTFNLSQLYLQTNTQNADYDDVRSLYNILNSSQRLSDPPAWRSSLDLRFGTSGFLKWLAANTVMENWDTYGKMSHNYYLYNNPAANHLVWIPWDNNESLRPGKQGGGISLALTEVTNGWPLIRFLANDSFYYAEYKSDIAVFISDIFSESSITSLIDSQAELIRSFATSEKPGFSFLSGPSSFESGITEIKQHCINRISAAGQFILTK